MMTPTTASAQQLSPHFTLREFVRSDTAARLQINNEPPPAVLKNLYQLAQFCELVRVELSGVAMLVSSGYRCAKLNMAVGGVTNSSHLQGLACDFIAPEFGSAFTVCQRLAQSTLAFDQLILEYSATAVWIHISVAASGVTPGRQVLTIDRHGTRTGLWMH